MSNKSGYDQFFQQKRQQKISAPVQKNSIEQRIVKNNLSIKKRKRARKPMPMKPVIWCSILLSLSIMAFENESKIVQFLNEIELSVFSESIAQEKSAPANEAVTQNTAAASKDVAQEKSSLDKFNEEQKKQSGSKTWTDDEIAMFTSLEARKKDLDRKEEELKRLEAELDARRAELDSKLSQLKDIRKGISDKLEETVQKDDEKINKLVEVYSNMKAEQAAKVFAKIDEELAIRVLSKMKKKNAADVLNLLEPEKAKRLSEKYVGYISMSSSN